MDEEICSAVSGKFGHKQEFIHCTETNKPLLLEESEKCEITGKLVMPGILEKCAITGKKVLPSELEKSLVSAKKALKRFFVSSSISNIRLLEDESIRSEAGKFCSDKESVLCIWSDEKYHPDDVKQCMLTGLTFHKKFLDEAGYFSVLHKLLDGTSNKLDCQEQWENIATKFVNIIGGGRAQIKNADSATNKKNLACSVELKTWAGLKTRQGGLVYSLNEKNIIGRVPIGKRNMQVWIKEK